MQWAAAYIAAAFALIQVLDVIAQRFGWPAGAEKPIILALGFIVMLLLAWYHGEKGQQWVSGHELLMIALILAVGGVVIWRFLGAGAPATTAIAQLRSPNAAQRNPGKAAPHSAAEAASSVLRTPESTTTPAIPIPVKSIAVLPFQNLSTDKANAYFAEGMQDLVLTKLADIGELKVISRTSTMRYQSHPDDLKAIARQLGVATRSADRARRRNLSGRCGSCR